jgi:predicted GIY-YIG superfamily endonuclease
MTQTASSTEAPSRRAAVYRLYDEAGALLYVGSSFDPDRRLADHQRKAWGYLIARRTVEWHPDRDAADATEGRAIEAERPQYNHVGTPEYAARRRAEYAATPGKWRVAYDANELRHRVAHQLQRFGYSWDRASAEGMILERAYKEQSGAFPNGVTYPSIEQITEKLSRP